MPTPTNSRGVNKNLTLKVCFWQFMQEHQCSPPCTNRSLLKATSELQRRRQESQRSQRPAYLQTAHGRQPAYLGHPRKKTQSWFVSTSSNSTVNPALDTQHSHCTLLKEVSQRQIKRQRNWFKSGDKEAKEHQILVAARSKTQPSHHPLPELHTRFCLFSTSFSIIIFKLHKDKNHIHLTVKPPEL